MTKDAVNKQVCLTEKFKQEWIKHIRFYFITPKC